MSEGNGSSLYNNGQADSRNSNIGILFEIMLDNRDRTKMDKQHIKELKKMIQEKKTEEPVEKVLVKFCARHGLSLEICRVHYRRLVEKGEIKEG